MDANQADSLHHFDNAVRRRTILTACLLSLALFFFCRVKSPEAPVYDSALPEGLIALDNENFSTMTGAPGRVAMVDFYSPDCGACRFMDSAVSHIAVRYKGKALIGKVNVLLEDELCSRFTIGHLPTFIFFHGGQEAKRISGEPAEDTLARIMDSLLTAAIDQ